MIIVAVDIYFAEGAIDGEGVHDALRTMVEETRKEPGCIKYNFSIDILDSSALRIYEEWESMQALELHFQTPHMANFQKVLGEVQIKSKQAKVYETDKELALPSL